MKQPDSISYGIEHFKGVIKQAKRNIEKNHKIELD